MSTASVHQVTETQRKAAREATMKRLRYSMHYAKRYSRFLETATWPDPNRDWIEPEADTTEIPS